MTHTNPRTIKKNTVASTAGQEIETEEAGSAINGNTNRVHANTMNKTMATW